MLRIAGGLWLLLLLAAVPAARAAAPAEHQDPRVMAAASSGPADLRSGQRAARARMGRFAVLAADRRTGTPRSYGRLDGLLTAESARDNAAVALDHVRARPEVFGLDAGDLGALEIAARTKFSSGTERIVWRQSYRGVPAIDTALVANLTHTGRLIGLGGAPRPDLAVASVEPAISADAAYDVAVGALGGSGRRTASADAHLVIFEGKGGPRLGWRLWVAVSGTAVYDAIVDAATGELARYANQVKNAVNARVFENHPGAAAGGVAATVDLTGYLDPGASRLLGDNTHTVLDPNDAIKSTSDYPSNGDEEVAPTEGHFDFPLVNKCPAGTFPCTWTLNVANSWRDNAKADATQLFWFVNNFHDHLESAYGFDAAAGNFEQGDGGAAAVTGDPVIAQSLDGANTASGLPDDDHINNANMLTPPDGSNPAVNAPHMQMYLSKVGTSGRSTGFDATVVYHEYTHGFNARTVIDPDGNAALGGAHGGAFDEGNADLVALDYLDAEGLLVDDPAKVGDLDAAMFSFGGLRNQATDCRPEDTSAARCQGSATAGDGGYTLGDFGRVFDGPEVHDDGEIYTQTMWQLRARLIAAAPSKAAGVDTFRKLLVTAMRLGMVNPTFLDWRNALLQADAVHSAGARDLVWEVFAKRGMGYFASVADATDVKPVQSFAIPPLPGSPTGTVSGTVLSLPGDAPAPGIRVGFAGHNTGLGPDLSDVTDASGNYEIAGVPVATYAALQVRPPASSQLETATRKNVAVTAGQTTFSDFGLRVNLAKNRPVTSATPSQDFAQCPIEDLVDGDQGTVWATTNPPTGQAREATVDLGAPHTVRALEIDPSAGCGDDAGASLGKYEVLVSGSASTGFVKVAGSTFGVANRGLMNAVALTSTPSTTRYVRLRALDPQNLADQYMDVTEMAAFATARILDPDVTTTPASAVTATSASLQGTLNPRGVPTTYQFEFDDEAGFTDPRKVPEVPVQTSSATSVGVNLPVTGLTDGQRYHYRLVAVRGRTRFVGATQAFTAAAPTGGGGGGGGTTPATAAPEVVTNAPGATAPDSAAVSGTVDPNGLDTTYYFEYGPGSDAAGATTAVGSLAAGADPVAVQATLAPLAPATAYSYRLVAVNSMGVSRGAFQAVTTAGVPPVPPPIVQPPAPPSVLEPNPVAPAPPAALSGTAKPTRRGVKRARVTCANAAAKVTCRVTFPGARGRRSVSARLSRGGTVLARGTARSGGRSGLVRVTGTRSLAPGTYDLAVKVGRTTYRFKLRLAA